MALLVWLAGLGLTALLTWQVHGANQRLIAERLAGLGDEVAALVSQRFGLYEYGLRGARGAVVAAGGPAVTREAFATYMDSWDTAREFPGARGFGFIRRVPRTDEAHFLATARAEGPPSFAIRELAAHSGERFVIQYIYPLESNQGATGLDVASEAHRRDAALAAARDGKARMTAPITLVQAGERPRRGFLIFLPIYRDGLATHTPEARAAAVFGWAYVPLLVDEVLAELGPRMQLIDVRLSDANERQPFFDSASATGPRSVALPEVAEISRELTIHGRRWQLQLRGLQALADATRPTPLAWVAGIAVAGSTLLAVLTWLLLQRRHAAEARDGQAATAPATLQAFLRSALLRRAALAYLLLVAADSFQGYRTAWTQQLGEARSRLVTLVDERAARLRAAQLARHKTLVFLADTPPVQGLLRALPTGVDPEDGSRRENWERRMQQILAAHLKASPEVYRARFVSLADGGRELVRVERRGGEVVAAPSAELQTLGGHADLRHAQVLAAGEVWVSDLGLNREQGQLEQPHRPTIRYTTPVHRADGQVFGVVMVHVDVADRLTDAAARLPQGTSIYVLNAADDFLLHPDPSRSFGADLGAHHRWSDEFQPAAAPPWPPIDDARLQFWRSAQGLMLAASAQVNPNPNSATGSLRYTAVLPLAEVEAAVWAAQVRDLVLPLGAGAIGVLLLYFYWVSAQRHLQMQEQRLRLAMIVDQSMDAIVGLDAAKCVTAWNRGAEQLFGFNRRQAFGRPLFDLIGASSEATRVRDGNGRWQATEFDGRHRSGRGLRLVMTRSLLSDDPASESLLVLRDVTDEREAQRQIVDLNRSLEQQLQERTDMLDVLAHEVRQPLHNASSALQTAHGALGDADHHDSAELLRRAQAVLVEVQRSVDNTLTTAALLARPEPIHVDDADIDTLVSVAIADMPSDERGRVRIRRDTATRTALMDVSLMRLALRNLLWNALKFSAPGSEVWVRIADSDSPLALLIDVIDQGPGIPAHLQQRLFTRGVRGNSPGSGHGLGLYIVAQVMELHRGRVELLRTGPGGSAFWLSIIQGGSDD